MKLSTITNLLSLLPATFAAKHFIDMNTDTFGIPSILRDYDADVTLIFRFYERGVPFSVIRSSVAAPCTPITNRAPVNSGVISKRKDFVVDVRALMGESTEPLVFYNGVGDSCRDRKYVMIYGQEYYGQIDQIKNGINQQTPVTNPNPAGPVVGGYIVENPQ